MMLTKSEQKLESHLRITAILLFFKQIHKGQAEVRTSSFTQQNKSIK